MPITANFQADFSSFTTAVAAATTKLITFEDEAKKVASSLSAMEKSISGVSIMQAATLATEAVARLGGASKLTYDELQRLGGTAQEAVEKMRALGQTVPAGIQNLADQARGASESFSRMQAAIAATEAEAKQAAAAMTTLDKSLSGAAIIQGATAAADAVGRIGGATKLTYAELQRLGGTAQEAVDKLKAMGQTVPPGIQNLADRARGASEEMLRLSSATKETQTSTLNWSSALSTATGVLGAFGVSASVGQLVQWGRAVVDGAKALVDYAGALSDMSAKTDMTVEQLQRLEIAGAASGVKLEDFTAASFKLGLALQGGEGSVVRAVEKLKLNYQQLAAMSVDQQFNTVAKALEGVSNVQERNRIGAELMSKTYSTIAPAIQKGFTDIAAAADVATKAQIDAIDRLGDAWDGFVTRRKAQAASLAGATVLGFQAFTDLSTAEKLEVLSSSNLFEVWDRLVTLGNARAKQVDIELPKDEKRTVQTKAQRDAAEKFADAMEEMNSVGKGWAGTLDTIDGNVVEAIKYYLDAGVAQNKLAIAYGLTVPQVNAVADSVKALTKADQDLAKHQAEADAIRMTSYGNQIKAIEAMAAANAKAYGSEEQIAALQRLDDAELALTKSVYENITSEKDRMKLIEQYGAKHAEITAKILELEGRRTKVVNDQVIAELEAQVKLNAAYGLTASGGIAQQETAYGKLQKALDDLHAKKVEGISQTNQENLLYKEYSDATAAAARSADGLRDAEIRKNAEVAKVPGVMAAAEAATRSYAAAASSSGPSGGASGGAFQTPSFGGYVKGYTPSFQLPQFKIPSYADGGVGDFGAGTLALLHGLEAIVPLDKVPAAPTNAGDLQRVLLRQQQEAMYALNFARSGAGAPAAVAPSTVGLTVDDLVLQNKKLVEQFYAEEEGRRAGLGGATITNNFYVNGTAEEAARKIADLVMRSVLDGTKMSA